MRSGGEQVGGSVTSISFNGRQYSVPADTDITLKQGGFENETLANGDGSSRLIKTRTPFSLTGVSVGIDDAQQDFEFLQNLSNEKGFFDVVIELASGAIWSGKAQITGELTMSSQSVTSGFDIMGTARLVQQ